MFLLFHQVRPPASKKAPAPKGASGWLPTCCITWVI